MAKLPAFQFYPGDWLRDAVSGCSLAAQGLWLRMMIIAHESDRYGYLEANGSPMQAVTIARRCGCDLPQYESLLSELTAVGVPSVTDKGTIYSRRMVRDSAKRSNRATSQRQRWDKKSTSKPPGSEDEDEDENEDSFPPSLESVRAYCLSRGNSIDPEAFVAHYTANGWVQSSGRPIKSWKAAVVTWEKRDRKIPHQRRLEDL